VATNDGEWWIYQELAEVDRASKREEVLTDRARLRNPKWWVASTATALIGYGVYEAIAAHLGDGRFTPSKVLWGRAGRARRRCGRHAAVGAAARLTHLPFAPPP
jgi:hypothetical protein